MQKSDFKTKFQDCIYQNEILNGLLLEYIKNQEEDENCIQILLNL